MSDYAHLTDYLALHAERTPDKLALVCDDRSLSWRELWLEVQAGAGYLSKRLDSNEQQIVALLMPNTWQYVVAYLSVVHAGHMAMPVDVIFKPLEIEAVLHQVSPALMITDDDNEPRLPQGLNAVINVKDFPSSFESADKKYLRLDVKEQVASLLFTSGTTGKPKVVPNTHMNHIWNIKACSEVWDWTAEDSQLISVRLSHMLGIVMGISGMLYHGNTTYLQDRFNEETSLKILASGKVSMFSHGPQVYIRLLEASKKSNYDLSGVRLFISGSGPLPPTVWQEFKEICGHEILEVYGTTETGRIASNLLNERIPGSPGRILPGVEVKIDEHGQVMVKSDGVLPGYLNNDEETRVHRTADGFWKTGDIGEFVGGRLLLKGRLQERIRKQGYTVSPRDVEWALHEDQRIKEVLVLGVQRPGEPNDKIVYFIVGDINEDQLREFCAKNLPSVWRPDQIFILPSLPRTRTGKPALRTLKAMLN